MKVTMAITVKSERNKEIFEKKRGLNGHRVYTYRELSSSEQYGLSIKRLQDIVNRESNKLLKE